MIHGLPMSTHSIHSPISVSLIVMSLGYLAVVSPEKGRSNNAISRARTLHLQLVSLTFLTWTTETFTSRSRKSSL